MVQVASSKVTFLHVPCKADRITKLGDCYDTITIRKRVVILVPRILPTDRERR